MENMNMPGDVPGKVMDNSAQGVVETGSYPLLAGTMAKHPALQVFRRFSTLNLKSLLYYEAELANLEEDLEKVEAEVRQCEDQTWLGLTSGVTEKIEVARSEGDPGTGAEGDAEVLSCPRYRQWQLMGSVRSVLDSYYQALQRQVEIENSYPEPRAADLGQLRQWHKDSRFDAGFLLGTPEDIWDTYERQGMTKADYLTAADTGDGLSHFVGRWLLRARRCIRGLRSKVAWHPANIFRQYRHSDVEANCPAGRESEPGSASSVSETIDSLDATGVGKVSNSILTVLGSVLPIVPIVVLYLLDDPAIQIGLVFVFTILMAALTTFGLSMNAEKVIAITTAFAAVQVVFIAANMSASPGRGQTLPAQ